MKRFGGIKTAYGSLAVNLSYGLYTAILGITGRSPWFLALAAYYMILGVMRFAVLQCAGKETERFIPRFIGVMFLFLAATLAGVTYLAFAEDRGVKHHEIVMITITLYAFVKIAVAIINLRKRETPAYATLRSISFADALVSVFSLQRSMLVSFEGMSEANIQLMNGLTGSAVYLLVFLLGIYLIGGKKSTMAKDKITAAVTDGYKKIENGVVSGYKKIENGVVSGYTKIEDKFIEQFLTKEFETVEDAKKRLKNGEK